MTEQATQVEQAEKTPAAYTPGEWRIFHAPDSRGVDRPTMICATAWGKSDLIGDFRGNEICNLCESHGNREHSYAECEANARLIAAAPELLEACKAARGMTGHNHWDNTMQYGAGCPLCIEQKRILAVIDAAIAKAEGK